MTCLERLQRWLREEHAGFSVQHHRQAFTLPDVAAELPEKAGNVAKVVAAKADGQVVMLVVPAPAEIDFKRVARLLKARTAKAAAAEDLKGRFPDCEAGAMPPFGCLYEIPTYMDEALVQTSRLVFWAGTLHDTLRLSTDDFLRLAKPITGALIKQPAEAAVVV